MDFDIFKLKIEHGWQNFRLLLAKIAEFFGFEKLGYALLSSRTREIQDVLDRMTEAEKAHLMKARGSGHAALYRMYRDKYLGSNSD